MMRRKPVFSQRGMALPITLILMVCITFVALGFAALYSGRLNANASYVDKYNAQYIAETGLNRYLWVLNNDPYNVNTFVAQNKSYQGYSQEGSGYYNIYCTTTLSGDLAPSILNLTCTGWLASDPRNQFSFTTTVQAREFNQYLYWTQKEEDSSGNTVYWGPNDVLHGGIFTDDIIHTLDDPTTLATPTFYGVVNYNYDNNGEAAAVAAQLNTSAIPNYVAGGIAAEFPNCSGNLPQYASNLTLPPNDSDSRLKAIAQDGQGYYYGRTCIYLQGNQYYVYNIDGGVINDNNGNPEPLPKYGVIYVDGEKDGQIDENTYDPASKFNTSYGNVFVSGYLSGQLTIYAANNIYLTAGDPTNLTNSGNPPTLATVNDSSNLVTYSTTSFSDSSTGATTSGTDMLGLVANNYVMILRWGWPTSSGYIGLTDPTGPYPYTPPTLDITGSIIQCYRGAVAGGDIVNHYSNTTQLGDGFVKNYYYDDRMQSEMPPYFLQPANSGWGTYGWSMNPIASLGFSQNASTPQLNPYNPSSPNTDQWSSKVSSTGVTVTPSPGNADQMSAVVESVNGNYNTPQTVTWSLSDPGGTGTTIDADTGLLTAGTAGTVSVTATANGCTFSNGKPATGSTTITIP